MLITLEHPAVPKGVTIKIDGSIDEDGETIARVHEVIEKLHPLRSGIFAKFRKAISPDVIKSITDKATDAAITGIATEAAKVK